ncbi:MAG: dihydropteroate synthase [Lachnospiraceae bacterium]|nr:dihydropteroate synthase [Lachnospiraceae bacterium]
MELLKSMEERILFFDGGMGSLLQAQGLKPGELPGIWNITHPDVLVEIHRKYLEAGADIILTNTFGADGLKYNGQTGYCVEEIVAAAIRNVKEAIRQSGRHAFVALDIGPTGKLLKPLGDLDFEDAVHLFGQVAAIGAREKVDLVLIETMSDSYEAKAAVLGAKENCDLPVFATVTFDERGKLLTGASPAAVVAMLEGLGVDALGVNCGLGPVQMKPFVKEILEVASVPVIVNPNAGLPRSENGCTVYDIDADKFALEMQEIVRMGARMVGGCCGTTPEHIEKMTRLCREEKPVPVKPKGRTVVSSFAQAVEIGSEPVIIGERINPTGKPKLKQALRDRNLEYILQEGVTQQEHGAHVLDVNVGLPEIDEPSMMEEIVKDLQSIIDLPLQIDTSSPEAMERAMRIYNGKPLINSVNGKEESMRQVFPLVKKYGGVVVALALDEGGIPEHADGRIAIARKIYKTAQEYGIGPENILIDALCLTISSDSRGAITTLETVKRVRDELGGKTILGVSNISFGLPVRENINAVFFTMALFNGLNAAIINPGSAAMMRVYHSYRALMDLDEMCGDYIRVYAEEAAKMKASAAVKAAGDVPDLHGGESEVSALAVSIERGLKEQAASAVQKLLKSRDSMDIINQEMIPALDRVGKGFEAGTIFLPQLLMSAEAAKTAFEIVREKMKGSGCEQEKKGTIILATVKGDIHDIGKNIVKVLLENYGYDVLDLGKDVPPERIVDTAVEGKICLVGLSALMTTTVPSMEETIRRLRQEAPWAKVMVGGAVLTREYADSMGADRYCRDAMASVNYAQEVFGK